MNTESEEPAETRQVIRQDLEDRLMLFERGLKERLLGEQRESLKKIAQAIVNAEIESLERKQERKRAEERLGRSDAWLNRILAGMIGLVIGMAFVATIAECSYVSGRVSALESKQKG